MEQTTEKQIVPTAFSFGIAKARVESETDVRCYDWFFCTKPLPKENIQFKP